MGGGEVARQKLETILKFTNHVSIVTREISDAVKNLKVDYALKDYDATCLEGMDIVYACTNNRFINRRIKQEAEARRIWVNVVDDPELCDFISPAVYTDDTFSIAVSTFGNSPSGAAIIRDQIRDTMPADKLNAFILEKSRKRKKNIKRILI